MPSLNSSARVFVSHSHKDNEITRRIVADLKAAGASVWVDLDDMNPGYFMQVVDQGLASSGWLILILTPNSLHSKYVEGEVFTALDQVYKGRMRGVIPVLAAHCDPRTIWPMIDSLHRCDITKDYGEGLANLLGILGLTTTRETAIVPAPVVNSGDKDESSSDRLLSFGSSQILPLYILMDTSSSMMGKPFEFARRALQSLYSEMMNDHEALETVWVSFITFSDGAQRHDFVPLQNMLPLELSLGGACALGEALQCLNEPIEKNLLRFNGTFVRRPSVILLLAGVPSDDWREQAEHLKHSRLWHPSGIASGMALSSLILSAIARDVFDLEHFGQQQAAKCAHHVLSQLDEDVVFVTRSITVSESDDLPLFPPPPFDLKS